MRDELTIYQNRYCKTTFLALPRLSYIILNRPVVKQYWNVRNHNKPIIITELQLNLQKHINICFCIFNKTSLKRKNCAPRKVLPNDKF